MDSALHYDTLITGGKIVTMDGEHRILENSTLAISDSAIQAIYSKSRKHCQKIKISLPI